MNWLAVVGQKIDTSDRFEFYRERSELVDGHFPAATVDGFGGAFGSGQPLCPRRPARLADPASCASQHEPQRQLLGQRRHGALLQALFSKIRLAGAL